MKSALTFLVLLVMTHAAQANSIPGIPSFDVDCPGKITVRADQDGPVLINNKEATTKAIDDRRFEAKGSGVMISIILADDDSVTVSSTGKAPNGVCQSVDD
ncbi:hypothetical protein PS862_04563 [Pseudomonas fluorescens]|uniref:Lipoprotein n=1 Tax=Pseudomonas fluorescens TaxID=294 RepID=A0A5E7NEB2_PSEFL|nr:hypothetical protein [Pseudomonas fluorescens]VVP34797.1 hypothetical protein PS862_04563 [Pseudomonas fluorescens]